MHTTVSPSVQRAAVTALGGQLGGVVAMVPATGQILAVAGIGLDDLQPPGSTFKMITLTGVLQAGLATPKTVFPYATYATLDGVKLNNANGEECGGTLALAFAVSCNSVFAPLGAKLGAARLVATAERYGFNHSPGVPGRGRKHAAAGRADPGPARPRLDRDRPGRGAGERAGDGDGRRDDRRWRPPAAADLRSKRRPRPRRRHVREQRGRRPHGQEPDDRRRPRRHRNRRGDPGGDGRGQDRHRRTEDREHLRAERRSELEGRTGLLGGNELLGKLLGSAEDEASNTDAWFASFAPAFAPRIVVGVLLVQDGAGGATAAPVARQVLEAGLQAEH